MGRSSFLDVYRWVSQLSICKKFPRWKTWFSGELLSKVTSLVETFLKSRSNLLYDGVVNMESEGKVDGKGLRQAQSKSHVITQAHIRPRKI